MTRFILEVPDEKDLKDFLPLFVRYGFVLTLAEAADKPELKEGEIDLMSSFEKIVRSQHEVFKKLAQ